jgi:hypothetical protein
LAAGGADVATSRSFPVGGYCLLGAEYETEEEIRVVADAGPLGYLAIAAHGQADALAFTLTVGGEPILIDAGTYVYQGDKKWRDYFRGTSAHNTLRVDSADQSVSGGTFLWTRHAHAVCEIFETSPDADRFAGSHDGYQRLVDPVRHRRELVLDKKRRTLDVRDEVRCRSTHLIEVFWHFSERCRVALEDGFAVVATPERQVRFEWPQGASVEQVCGRDTPPLGWLSHRFHDKRPSTTIVVSKTATGDWDALTRIHVGRRLN